MGEVLRTPSSPSPVFLTLTFWMHLVHGTKKGQRVKPNPPPPRCNIILLGAGGRLLPKVLSSSLRRPAPVVSHRLGGLLFLISTRTALLPAIGRGASTIPHAPTVMAFGVEVPAVDKAAAARLAFVDSRRGASGASGVARVATAPRIASPSGVDIHHQLSGTPFLLRRIARCGGSNPFPYI